jgi:hypothetical protein
VGVHTESFAPFRHLIANGDNVLGLVRLEPESLVHVSGAVDRRLLSDLGVPVAVVSTREPFTHDRTFNAIVYEASQVLESPSPHLRSLEALADRARFWCSVINRPCAEAFVVVRSAR